MLGVSLGPEEPTITGTRIDVHGMPKPLLRGGIHLVALVASIPAGVALVLAARSGTPRVAALVFAASLTALFTVSSGYHLLGRPGPRQVWLRRLDHATIYVLIAGSYTPVCLVVLTGWMGWSLFAAVWTMAALGVVLKVWRFATTQMLGTVLYMVMGWTAVLVVPALVARQPGVVLGLIAAGGLLYTVGAVVLGRRRPNPIPGVFGYHEVWHTFVVAAAACHYVAILQIVS